MGTLVNKDHKYCGTCSHWKGDVKVSYGNNVEIRTNAANCDKRKSVYIYNCNSTCRDWQQRYK